MPLHIKQNLPETVIDILNIIKRYRTEARTHLHFDVHASLQDLETHLCDLLSSMIASPITGRLFLLPPSSYVTPQDMETNLSLHFTQH